MLISHALRDGVGTFLQIEQDVRVAKASKGHTLCLSG